MKLLAMVLVLVAGCGGRDARPVPEYRPGDDAMTCEAIKVEMASAESKMEVLIPKTNKTGKNVALGVTGWFLIVPLFFMDFSDAEKVEIQAYQTRLQALDQMRVRKHCGDELPTA